MLALPVRGGVPFTAAAVAALALGLARHAVEGGRRWRLGLTARELGPREWILCLVGFAAVAFLLSVGPVVRVAGQPVDSGLYAWLYPYLVPLRAIRAVTRIGVLVLFAVAVLAALGVMWLSARLPRAGRAVVAVAAVLLLLESATFPLSYERVALARPIDAALGRVEPEAVVLEWPTYVPETDADAMLRSVAHGRRIVNGYSGFVPEFIRELSGLLTTPGPVFPVPEAQAALRRIHPLRYLVVRLDNPAVQPEWRAIWLGLRTAPPPLLRFRGATAPPTFTRSSAPGAGDVDRAPGGLRPPPGPFRAAGRGGTTRRHPGPRPARGGAPQRPARRDRRAERRGARHRRAVSPFNRAAPNAIVLRHAYERPAGAVDAAYEIGRTGRRSPADLRVRSGGLPWGDRASIEVNAVEHAGNRRGYDLVALEATGRVRDRGAFDTFADRAAPARWWPGSPDFRPGPSWRAP